MSGENIAALLAYAIGDELRTELVLLVVYVLILTLRRAIWRSWDDE